mgnify:FL=1
MNNSQISTYFLPILPIYGLVCRPGQIVSLNLKNQDYYAELFSYVQKHTNSQIALGYLTGPRTKKPSFYHYMSIANLDNATCSGNKESSLWTLQLSDIRTAIYDKHSLDSSLPFWQASLTTMPEETYSPNLHSPLSLLKLWITCRRMAAKSDDPFASLTPSRGNRYFKAYFQDFPNFLNLLYKNLPLTFSQRVQYLGAFTLDDKTDFMLDNLELFRKAGLRIKIIPGDYACLCRINKDAADVLLRNN